jgi:hypothetical protein
MAYINGLTVFCAGAFAGYLLLPAVFAIGLLARASILQIS